MKEGMIYFVKSEFYEIIRMIGGEWNDNKKRPVVCLFKLKERDDLYWAIPMGDWHHRDQVHKQRIIRYVNLSEDDLRSCYYHVGRTTGKSIFFISDVFPVTDKYVEREYLGFDGTPYEIKNRKMLIELERKLRRILYFETKRPNYFRQHITDIKNFLLNEEEDESYEYRI